MDTNQSTDFGSVIKRKQATFGDGKASGIEVELIKRFAREQGVKVHWVPGAESPLFEALKRFKVDIVIGGVHRDTPWKKEIAHTQRGVHEN